MSLSFIDVAAMTLKELQQALKRGVINIHELRDSRTGGTLLHQVVGDGALGKTRLLLARRAAVNIADYSGQTPLHVAVQGIQADAWLRLHAKLECAKMLLDRGADVNAQDREGRTPLHCVMEQYGKLKRYARDSSTSAHDEVGHLLLEHGADASIRDESGRTPEEFAVAIIEAPW